MDLAPIDSSICHFCARIFESPDRIANADRILNEADMRTFAHKHRDEIQFDLIVGCRGSVMHSGTRVPLQDSAAFVFYPDDLHAHNIVKHDGNGEVMTCRVRVELDWPLISGKHLPRIVPNVQDSLLARIMRMVAWLGSVKSQRIQGLTAFAQALAIWPRHKSGSAGIISGGDERLHKILTLIDDNLVSPPSIDEMSEVAGLSTRQVIRQFKTTMGCTPHRYVNTRRMENAKKLLASGRLNVTEVAEMLGFTSVHAFSHWFQREACVNPSRFRERPPVL